MNPLEHTLENQLSEEANARWLQALKDLEDTEGLLKAALLLNTLYHTEKTKTRWAVKEAADNLKRSL